MKRLTDKTGVYVFLDAKNKPLYVGKAVNLRRRVLSYFRELSCLDKKVERLLLRTAKIKTYRAESEIAALLLEADLIKRLKPLYNSRLRDDKSYQFIRISQEAFPRLEGTHQPQLDSFPLNKNRRLRLFGPYPLGDINFILKTLRRIFPFRDCREVKFKRYQKLGRPCLYGDLNLCPAPCIGRISASFYQQHIKNITAFLQGKKKKVVTNIKKEMRILAKNRDFEKAAFLRDRWQRLALLNQAAVTSYSPNRLESFVAKEKEKGQPNRSEAFDISHLSGQAAVGSMVVFRGEHPEKESYRRFKIKAKRTLDDYAMIAEVLRRRLTNKEIGALPDLILVDGGPGQLAAALKVQEERGLYLPTYALAKRQEDVYTTEKTKIVRLVLPRSSPLLHFLQRMRDEAHRFALSYQRQLRTF